MNDLTIFNYNNSKIRVVDIDGNAWFVAKDVCDVLGLSDVSMTVAKLDDDEKLVQKLFVSGQNRDVIIISESGLYGLILRSNKTEAKKFSRWVRKEVLPQIRKTGSYSVKSKHIAGTQERKISTGIIKSAAKIYSRAFQAKSKNDVLTVLALDKAFQHFTGESALKIAGISLVSYSSKTARGYP